MNATSSSRPLQARAATVLVDLLSADLPEVVWHLWTISDSPAADLYADPTNTFLRPLEGHANSRQDVEAWAAHLGSTVSSGHRTALSTTVVIDGVKLRVWCRR